MKLSIVIVNYNVKYFLKQCLESVEKAITDLSADVFVVDNKSTDGSVEMVADLFPWVKLIANKDNVGFSRANNQAIRLSKAKYVLLLNPDTIVAEDTFHKVISFMDETPKAGGLGVKMVDGNGKFLPESKRGLPTPDVAFYKIFGLSSIFPKSKIFSKYHLGYLSNDQTNKIDVLSGAFMFLRKETLDKVGLLDETFFMYGEDIDLSYRITLGGYDNYYYPHSSIIHYKGESTKKSSVNYVFIFYKAMAIFAEKHFGKSKAGIFSALIKIAIFLRATLALVNRFIEIAFLPLIDASVLFGSLHIAKRVYQNHSHHYNDSLTTNIGFGGLCLIIFIGLLFNGSYDKPVKPESLLKGLLFSIPIILVSFLFVQHKFYVNLIHGIIAIIGAGLVILLVRYLLHVLTISPLRFTMSSKLTLLIGTEEEIEKSSTLISLTQPNTKVTSIIVDENSLNVKGLVSNKIKEQSAINEIIFCTRAVSYQETIELMMYHSNSSIDFKIAYPNSKFIIGSTNLNTSGELYLLKLKGITSKKNKRAKRTFDLLLSFVLLVTFPINCWFVKDKTAYLKNLYLILTNKLSFIGFSSADEYKMLPFIKKGVLSLNDLATQTFSEKHINEKKMNLIYAHDYSIQFDFKIVKELFNQLGKQNN